MRQETWDLAALLADRGTELPAIITQVLEVAGPQIEAQSVLEIRPHGRTFWSSLARVVAWGIVADLGLLVAESLGARPVPVLKVAIYAGVLLWALGFGVIAGNSKVHQRRNRVGSTNRVLVERLAQAAAHYVWAAQVPGDWQPLGPVPIGGLSQGDTAASAWLRRFGVPPAAVIGLIVDGTLAGLSKAIRDHPGVPVALFVQEPGVFTDEARSAADLDGIALFVVGAEGLHAMSAVASSTLRAYRSGSGRAGPKEELLRGWSMA
jgi:hypothetical protein